MELAAVMERVLDSVKRLQPVTCQPYLQRTSHVLNFVSYRWPDARHVHRLDQDTSGIVVMALTVEAAREMSRQFRERGERYECRLKIFPRMD